MGVEKEEGGGKQGGEAADPTPQKRRTNRRVPQGQREEIVDGGRRGRGGEQVGRGQGRRDLKGGYVRGHPRGGGRAPPLEEKADLPVFTPEHVHLLLQKVYGDFLHHNDGSHLEGGIADDALWQRCWIWLAPQSASWYATLSEVVGHPFTAILAAEWQGVPGRS